MAVEDPPGVLNVDSTDSAVQRHTTQGILGGAVGAFAGGVLATNAGAHGVCGSGDLAVTQSGTPGMSVKVAKGLAIVTGTASALQGPYSVYNDADIDPVTIAAADATNPRKDLVIAQVRDATYDGTGIRDARITVVTGTPAASPVDPSLSTFPNALVLARVDVPALDTSITNSQITDLRTFAGRQEIITDSMPSSHAVSGTGGVTSAGTELIVSTLSIPARRRAGRIDVQGFIRIQKSVVGDIFAVRLKEGATILAECQTYQGTAFEWPAMSGFHDIAAATVGSFFITFQRISGSGTATAIGGPSQNNITATYTPTP